MDSTTVVIPETISSDSAQAATVGSAKIVTAVAPAKGATASAFNLPPTNGVLKIMAWTNPKTAIVVSACVALAAAVTTIIVVCCRETAVRGIPKNWSVLSGSPDQWNWANGAINGHTTTGNSVLASSKEYRDVTLSADVGTTNREASLALRMQDGDNGYVIIFAPSGTPREDAGHVALVKWEDGQETALASYHGRVFSTIGQSANVSVIAKGPWIQVHLNDITILRVKDTTFASGFIGLRMYGDPDSPCDSTFSNVTFY